MNIAKIRDVYHKMIQRVEGRTKIERDYRYFDCSVASDWKSSNDFINWAVSVEEAGYYQDGWQLDKDILIRGNKMYGPDTCCFVPQEINKLLIKADRIRGDYPIGVHKVKSGYRAQCCIGYGKQVSKTFRSVEQAFLWYKNTKEDVIKSVAEQWKDKIDPRVYSALIRYEVSYTD